MSAPWKSLLPTSVDISGKTYDIRSDYRAILDICKAIQDPELTKEDKIDAALDIFYIDYENMPLNHYQEAIEKCFWFIDCGNEENQNSKKRPQLVNWEQDFQNIVAPINRVCGFEIRAIEYMHWWTFIAAYMEIGDCTWAQVIRVRNLLAKGKKLDKPDQEWYRQNRNLVDFKQTYTESENDILSKWGVK